MFFLNPHHFSSPTHWSREYYFVALHCKIIVVASILHTEFPRALHNAVILNAEMDVGGVL